MSKFGAINIPLPDLSVNRTQIADDLAAGTITEAAARTKLRALRRLELLWIARTNNTSQLNAAGQKLRRNKQTITSRKDDAHAAELEKIRVDLLGENLAEEVTVTKALEDSD